MVLPKIECTGRSAHAQPQAFDGNIVIRSAQELVDRFYGLPVLRKAELIERLQLLEPAENCLPEHEQYNLALMRARDRGKLLALARGILELGG